MTTSFLMRRNRIALLLMIPSFLIITLISCKKDADVEQPPAAAAHSAEVLDKWMTIELRLMRNATGIPNQAFTRHFAYAGIAALESIKPGMKPGTSWTNRWNGLTGLPVAAAGADYYYPANINAAMASINKNLFPNASVADKAAIDSLETALNNSFVSKKPADVLAASAAYGKAVAVAVFNWAETDGYKDANNPYTPATGDGKWVPTAPAFAPASTPYWGNNRPIVSGSTANSDPGAPLIYSTNPASGFYAMVKKVYDVSQTLTDDQKAMAVYWRDVPGATSPGHWLSIMQQVIKQKGSSLDKAALAYALTGVSMNDAIIACFKYKYQYNLVRPITYVRNVMGQASWNPYLTTPAHPEYVSAHSDLSAAAAVALEKIYGNNISITDHTYDYMGLAPRSYTSFSAIATEAGYSRLYAGIHYEESIVAGLNQGKKVASNIFRNGLNP
jgi:hypothetical protein